MNIFELFWVRDFLVDGIEEKRESATADKEAQVAKIMELASDYGLAVHEQDGPEAKRLAHALRVAVNRLAGLE